MRILVAVTMLVFSPTVKGELCHGTPKTEKTPASYGRAMIASLGCFKEAYDLELAPTQKDLSAIGKAVDLMAFFKRRISKTRCAAEVLQGFSTMKDDPITTHQREMKAVSALITLIDQGRIEAVKATLDGKLTGGELAEKIAELGAEQDETLKLITYTTARGMAVFIDSSADRKNRLNITATERAAIISNLIRTMGPVVKSGALAGQEAITAAGGMIHGFLTDESWTSRP